MKSKKTVNVKIFGIYINKIPRLRLTILILISNNNAEHNKVHIFYCKYMAGMEREHICFGIQDYQFQPSEYQ